MQHPAILILEDNAAIANRLRQLVGAWQGAQLVGVCGNLEVARAEISRRRIDLLMADLHLPDGSGVEAIRDLRARQPAAHAIVISALNERSLVVSAIRAGATGYILKDEEPAAILDACRAVLAGESPMSASVARQIIQELQQPDRTAQPAGATGSANPLTPRENDVLLAISRGFSYRDTADLLGLSEKTVPVHIRNIYRKLEVNNRSEAVYEARRLGFLGE